VPTRRAFLRTLTAAGVVGTAGCSAGDGPLLADGFEDGLDPWTREVSPAPDAGGEFASELTRTDERAHEGSWSIRVDTAGRGGTTWLVRPLSVPADANRLSVAVVAWSESPSFAVRRDLVVALRPSPPETAADFPDPGANSGTVPDAPFGGLREPLDRESGWREYATSWGPDALPDRLSLAVGVSAVRAVESTHYLDEVLVTTR
jgi:hypothetical protein